VYGVAHRNPSGLPEPFGMRYLVPGQESPAPVGRYDESMQIWVTADGNPWHALADGDTQSETNNGDGAGSGSDSGTDLY
jgi:putative ATP-grasp target RiPP